MALSLIVDNTKTIGGNDEDQLVFSMRENVRLARNIREAWLREAEVCDKMEVGHQWDAEDVEYLEEFQQPIITFNRIKPIVDAISGTEIQMRQELLYVPRVPELEQNGLLGDLATNANKWAIEGCNGHDERSIAFHDTLVRGMGWTEEFLDYEEDPDGKIKLRRVDGREMWWDTTACGQNLYDARWVARKRWMLAQDVKAMYPDAVDKLSTVSFTEGENDDAPSLLYERRPNETYQGFSLFNQLEQPQIYQYYWPVWQFQWWEYEEYYRIVNPQDPDGPLQEFTKEMFLKLRDRLAKLKKPQPDYVKQRRKKYFEAYICGTVLLHKHDLAVQNGFTLKCITGAWDASQRIWFGIVRAMVDPQRAANKWLSQGLHIVNHNAKGGVMIELDAVESPEQFESSWADPSGVTFVKPGAIANNKVMPKPQAQFPEAMATMIQYAVSSMREVTGVNIDLLGYGAEQQGSGGDNAIQTRQRQKQGLAILAIYFNALTRYRVEEGRTTLHLLRDYIADGRLIRISGQDTAKSIPLLRDPLSIEYDIIIDENPQNPNVKSEIWAGLTQLAPALLKFNLFDPELLRFSPLPTSIVNKLVQKFAQNQEADSKPPPDVQAKIDKLRADALLQVQRARALEKETQVRSMEAIMDALRGSTQDKNEERLTRAKATTHEAESVKKLAEALGAQQQKSKPATNHDDTIEGVMGRNIDYPRPV